VAGYELKPGAPVVLYLHDPREKVWGLLLSVTASGVLVRGLDLTTFEDWMRQEARGEDPLLGLCTIFYPMGRLERMERDETVGSIPGYVDRFAREVGRTVWQVLGIAPEE
jgi:hypothetical protein